jgi:galactose-1-phosphate uridylyltransferase
MFLNRLTIEEKVAFLELAHHVARSDNDFSDDQKEIIAIYCLEMQIEDIDYKEEDYNLDTTLSKFQNSTNQKIILLEVMALVYSDNILHEEEKKILDAMIAKFDLNPILVDIYAEWTKSILAITAQGQALIEL